MTHPDYIEGPFGWARRVRPAPAGSAAADVSVAAWLLHLPGQSHRCAHFMLSMATMEDRPELLPATSEHPLAAFDLILYGLDPEGLGTGSPDAADPGRWWPLYPAQLAERLGGIDRIVAGQLADAVARALVWGMLPATTMLHLPFGGEWNAALVADSLELWRSSLAETVTVLMNNAACPQHGHLHERAGGRDDLPPGWLPPLPGPREDEGGRA